MDLKKSIQRSQDVMDIRPRLDLKRKAATSANADLMEIVKLKTKTGEHFVHFVNHADLGNGQISGVFIMSTMNLRDSGVDLLRRLHPDAGLDLSRSWVSMDFVERHVIGWKTLGLHVYSPEANRTLTIAWMYVKDQQNITVTKFWALLKETALKKGGIKSVAFWGIMADGEGTFCLY